MLKDRLVHEETQTTGAPELSVIVPTFNECRNVLPLVDRLRKTLAGLKWEVIFVDDNSADGTADEVLAIGKKDYRVRCVRRINRRGLSGACLEGILSSQATFVAVIDGDLQHDETCLVKMLQYLKEGHYDLVVGTRYANNNEIPGLTKWRTRVSQWATELACRFLRVTISDPMSGFFMVRRDIVDHLAPKLKTQGFKILLDIITSSKQDLRIVEIPYTFKQRVFGASKLDTKIIIDFISLIIDKRTAGLVSSRFILYSMIGSMGLGLHIMILHLLLQAKIHFTYAQSITTLLIISCNYFFNNIVTYRDQRLTGKYFLLGLLRYEAICSIGLIANVSVAFWLYSQTNLWWLAGLCGAIMGAAWNYMISANFVWRST